MANVSHGERKMSYPVPIVKEIMVIGDTLPLAR